METTLQLDDKLLAEANHFAKQSHQSLSEVVAEALYEKISKFSGKTSPRQNVSGLIPGLHPDIRRLTGLAPDDWDAKAIYHKQISTRHA